MDVLPLLPSFTDSSLPSSCSDLWLEMVKAHGNLSKNEIKFVIKYLDDALKKYKSNDSEPLELLYHLVNRCSASVLVENCLSWMDKLVKIIQVNCSELILGLACDTVISIIPYVVQNSELNRQFCNSVLSNLVSILLNEDIINAHKLNCLREIMKTFPGPCRQFQNEIEKFVMAILVKTADDNLQQAAAQCLIISPIITTEPEIGWNVCFKKLLKTIHTVLKDLFERVEKGDPVWKSDYPKSFAFPLISSTHPVLQFKSLQRRFNLLCYCLKEMLSVDYPYSKEIPVKDVIGFVTRVIIVTPFSIKCSTSDDLMLVGVLPILHESVFSVLKSLIATCRKLLIPESSTICKIITKGLKWTSTPQADTTNKSFSDLRCQIYSTLKLWAEAMSAASGLKEFSSELYKHFVNDMRNPDKKIQLENSGDDKYRRKRKRGLSFSGIGSVGPIKDDPFTNNNICVNCLKALKSVHFAIGSTIHPTVYSDICKTTLHLVFEIQTTLSKTPTPYDDPECRRALYDALFALVLACPRETGSCLQLSIKIFSRGVQDSHQNISSFCTEALTVCEQLIHPRLPSLHFAMEAAHKPESRNHEPEIANSNEMMDDSPHEPEIANSNEMMNEIPMDDSPQEEVNETTETVTEVVDEVKPATDEMQTINGLESEESVEIIDIVSTEAEMMESKSPEINDEAPPVHANVEDKIEVVETPPSAEVVEDKIEVVETPPSAEDENVDAPATKKRLIYVNDPPIPSQTDEALLTVEEMLQDLVSDHSNDE